MIVLIIVFYTILHLLFTSIRLTMANFIYWLYNSVVGTKNNTIITEEQNSVNDDAFVVVSSTEVNQTPDSVAKTLSETVAETCREELDKNFKDRHLEKKPKSGLKVNNKKGKRKKSSYKAFEKVDIVAVEDSAKPEKAGPSSSKGKKGSDEAVEVTTKKSSAKEKNRGVEQKINIDALPPSSIILHYQKKEKVKPDKTVDSEASKEQVEPAVEREEVLAKGTVSDHQIKEPEIEILDQVELKIVDEHFGQIVDKTQNQLLESETKLLEESSTVQVIKTPEVEIVDEHFRQSKPNADIEKLGSTQTKEISEIAEPNQLVESETRLLEESSETEVIDQVENKTIPSISVGLNTSFDSENYEEESIYNKTADAEFAISLSTSDSEVNHSRQESSLTVLDKSKSISVGNLVQYFEGNQKLKYNTPVNFEELSNDSTTENSFTSDLDKKTPNSEKSETPDSGEIVTESAVELSSTTKPVVISLQKELDDLSTFVNVSSSDSVDELSDDEAFTISLNPEVKREFDLRVHTNINLPTITISSIDTQTAALPVTVPEMTLRKEAVSAEAIENNTNSNNENQSQDPEQISTSNAGESNYDANRFAGIEPREVRVLTLNANEHQDTVLYRVQQNCIIMFRLGPSLLGRKVLLFCNYPQRSEQFQRGRYYPMTWFPDTGCNHSDDTALYAMLIPQTAGSFHYYFTYSDKDCGEEPQGSGYISVDPILRYGDNEKLPLDCIQCQTVLAKSLGSFSTWESKLRVAKESGYNMIHFTPIQELGGSKSSYCLSEQLKLNHIFSEASSVPLTFEDIEQLIDKLRREWKVISICDIVLNHTANESVWLKTHPEATFNCRNCPYLRPAYLLDAAFHQFSHDVRKGVYENKGIPLEVNSEEHLNAIRYAFNTEVLPVIKIHELFICDANKLGAEFLNLARNNPPRTPKPGDVTEELELIQDQEFKRVSCAIDMDLALKIYNVYRPDCFDEETRIKRCGEEFKKKLDALNETVIARINEHLSAAVENVIAGIRYFRVQSDGPRIKEVSVKNPLTQRYFTDYGNPLTFSEHEEIMYGKNGKFLMAHNGWVMNADPLRNFAASDSNVYLRRELIAWGDSVKLRYGEKPEDSPFLWSLMRAYVEQTVKIFDGVRLDNCHSTPIVVAEYLLDCARKIRPNLYVVAELFTNSDHTDNIFVNRLGITSLIREAMSAWDSHEEGRLVYRYGGQPVGSFPQARVVPFVPTVAHALFLDLTHDNPSPVQKRSIFDLLPSSALVSMACCASGSNRGYDELVPHHIHVVDETRQYTEWSDNEELSQSRGRCVGINSGIIAAKRAMNKLHYMLGHKGFNQVYVDQMDSDVVAVTRHDPIFHESVVLVAFTAFNHPDLNAATYQRNIRPLRIEGVVEKIVFEATLSHKSVRDGGSKYTHFSNFKENDTYINGVNEYFVEIREDIPVAESQMLELVDSGTAGVTQLNFKDFKPGSVVALRILQQEDARKALSKLRQFSQLKPVELTNITRNLTLEDLNHALYKCDQEERDAGFGFSVYNIPNHGSLVYAGFQGFMSLLENIRPNNDLGHPMCANLRDGNWMIDYIWQRLIVYEGTRQLGEWLEENTKPLKQIPRYLVPSYFDMLVTDVHHMLLAQCYNLMSKFVNCGSKFVRSLAFGSVQMGGIVKSAKLPTLSPALDDPKPTVINNEQVTVTLAAGLPHFTTGYMRNWGRDTFIALRGIFILTGRYQEARYHILGYAACLRHGLIPNLLDGGNNPRYNCRDAVWWWLQSIKFYVEEAPNGVLILQDMVSRIYPTDESENQPAGAFEQHLYDVMQEGLNVHFQGLAFRERNAGRQIDEHMTDRGFNNQIGVHPETGFVFGGNEWNCGTWMDKMGSSDKAGIRGKPATPRDGSAIELIGLSKSVVSWLAELNSQGLYAYDGVERTQKNGKKIKWTFHEWAEKIQNNFEKYFWVNTVPVEGELRPDLVNKRGIYKDCYGATQQWTDYQLRCNFPIAMVVAPELFDPKHAWTALEQAEKYLLGPLGMKTLDPEDWVYRGDYDNSNDSSDPNVSHGINYHQGPEWVWPVGFYLRARLIFASANNALEKTIANTKIVLSKHFTELQTSPWCGLPELTNKDGAYCKDSCRTQAWSMSCVLEVLADLQKIEAGCN